MTPQEKKVLVILGAFAVLGLAVLAYRAYFARPKLKVVHSELKSGAADDYEKIIKRKNEVNINAADVQAIEALPGIGPKLAKDIVDYRAEHGSFLIKEDLRKVRGIGQSKFDAIKDLIVLE